MANQEHLSLVKGGTKKWNRWRDNNPDIIPDFRDADLSGINLSGAELSKAIMRGTTLVGTIFQDADLGNAELAGANLRKANLSGANLGSADLSEADLRNAILIEAFLESANLSSSNLSWANLNNANLHKAILCGAVLRLAELQGAYLLGADLSEAEITLARLDAANLTNANLSSTILYDSVFTDALLDGADLTESHIGDTIFANNDLSQAKGLDTIIHFGPSSIGVDTIYKSKGKIPESFLIGAGIPDNFVIYMKSLIGNPIEFYSCFISHSSKNAEFAKQLHSKLRDEQVRVWYAPEDLKGGKELLDQIDQAIRIHDKLLLVLSEESINSEWVQTEIRKAFKAEAEQKKRKLFPIRLIDWDTLQKWECFDTDTGRDLAVEVRKYFIPDFSNWKEYDSFKKALDKLVQDLKASEKVE